MRAPLRLAVLATIASLSAVPALAHDHLAHDHRVPVPAAPAHWGGPFYNWYGGWQPQVVVYPAGQPGPNPVQGAMPNEGGYDRDGWLRECRRRLGDNGVGGAVIGGVVGGVAGNVIAGQGNRTLGTVAGAVVGAVAGSAIDKAEDRNRVMDRCEAMLQAPQAAYGYGPGYGAQMMMVPVMLVPMAPGGQPASPRKCTETVVTEEVIDTAPRRARHIPRRAPDKRVRLVPDKRVPQ